MKDNESLRVIVVGLGMHSSVWINTIRSRNDCVIAACVAPSEKSRSRTADEHHIKPDMLFASLDAALEKIRADFAHKSGTFCERRVTCRRRCYTYNDEKISKNQTRRPCHSVRRSSHRVHDSRNPPLCG